MAEFDDDSSDDGGLGLLLAEPDADETFEFAFTDPLVAEDALALAPDDPLLSRQTHYDAIHLETAWALAAAAGGNYSGVVVQARAVSRVLFFSRRLERDPSLGDSIRLSDSRRRAGD